MQSLYSAAADPDIGSPIGLARDENRSRPGFFQTRGEVPARTGVGVVTR